MSVDSLIADLADKPGDDLKLAILGLAEKHDVSNETTMGIVLGGFVSMTLSAIQTAGRSPRKWLNSHLYSVAWAAEQHGIMVAIAVKGGDADAPQEDFDA